MTNPDRNDLRKRYYSHYPLTHPAWLIARLAGRHLEVSAPKYLRGRLIDIGCGGKWKEDLIGQYADEYIGLDHEGSIHDKSDVDLMGTVYDIPADENSFDSAVCTAVLEHVEEPSDAVAECYRVLKKDAYAVYTVPLFWHLHEEPRDFYRYTKYGLTHLFEKNNFKIIELIPMAGFWVTTCANWAYYLHRFKRCRWFHPLRWFATPMSVCIHWFAAFMNRFDHSPEFTWMYLIVVQK